MVNPDTEAEVVGSIVAGLSLNAIAKKYKLARNTVMAIRARHFKEGEIPARQSEAKQEQVEQAIERQKSTMDEKLADAVDSGLDYLKRIPVRTSRDAYIDSQTGRDNAALYREIKDFTLQILEAAGGAEEEFTEPD